MTIWLASFTRWVIGTIVLWLWRACGGQHLFELRVGKDWVAVQRGSSRCTWAHHATLHCIAPRWPIAHTWSIGSTDRVTLAIAILSESWLILLSRRAGPIGDGVTNVILVCKICNATFSLIGNTTTDCINPCRLTIGTNHLTRPTTASLSLRCGHCSACLTTRLLNRLLLWLILLHCRRRCRPIYHTFCLLYSLLIPHELFVQILRVADRSRWIDWSAG